MKTAFVIFTGYNQRGGHRLHPSPGTAWRGLLPGRHRARGHDFPDPLCLQGRLHTGKPRPGREHLYPALGCVAARAQGKELVFAPSTEALNRFFLGHRFHLEKLGIRVPLVGESLYKTISDKSAFSDLCHSSHIRVPAPIRDPGDCPLPFAAKPSAYDPAKGLAPVLVFSEQDREILLPP